MTDWPVKTLDALCDEGVVLLGRGNIISKKDIAANPGPYPIYSSARENEGKFGEYGAYMFNEEMITWSIDGGGRLFYRSKHKFSVTNVGGTLRVLKPDVLEIRYLHRALENLHSRKVFDWVFKAHPSVIRKVYDEIPIPPLDEQKRIVALLDAATARVTELTACYEQARTHANNLFTSALRELMDDLDDTEVMTLSDICIVDWGNTNLTKKSYLENGDYLAVSAGGPDGRIGHSEHKAFTPVLSAIGARCGRMFLPEEDFTAIKNTITLTPKSEAASGKYIYFLFEHLSLPIRGAAQPFIAKGDIEKFEVAIPPLNKQEVIVERLELVWSKTSEMVTAYDAKLVAAKNLRQSVLESAFAGEL